MKNETIKAFWDTFLAETGRPMDTRYYDSYYFGGTEQSATELLALVLSGRKRATTSAVAAYEAEGLPLPRAGDLCIVTEWDGTPRCVVETTQVTILPFCEMTFDICKREGEDECLETWRENHIRFFTAEAEAEGYAYDERMPVVFEDFRLVYRV